jgi:Zn-dependent protease with chaperone function
VIAWAIMQGRRSDNDRDCHLLRYRVDRPDGDRDGAVLGSLLVMWFSRWRELGADAGGRGGRARQSMIGALRPGSGRRRRQQVPQPAVQTLRIPSSGGSHGFLCPPAARRAIARLEQMV